MFSLGHFRLAPRCGGETRFFNQTNGIQIPVAHLNQAPSADYGVGHAEHSTKDTPWTRAWNCGSRQAHCRRSEGMLFRPIRPAIPIALAESNGFNRAAPR